MKAIKGLVTTLILLTVMYFSMPLIARTVIGLATKLGSTLLGGM